MAKSLNQRLAKINKTSMKWDKDFCTMKYPLKIEIQQAKMAWNHIFKHALNIEKQIIHIDDNSFVFDVKNNIMMKVV